MSQNYIVTHYLFNVQDEIGTRTVHSTEGF